MNGHAFFLDKMLRYAQAISVAQAALLHVQHASDTHGEALACFVWGNALCTRLSSVLPDEDFRHGREKLERAIALCGSTVVEGATAQLRLRSLEAECMYSLAVLLACHGEHVLARSRCEQALRISRTIGNRFLEESMPMMYAELLENEGRFEQILHYREQALDRARESGNLGREAICHINIADVLRLLGQYAEAREHGNEALRLYQQLGFDVWPIHLTLSSITYSLGAPAEALAHAQLCLDAVYRRGDRVYLNEAKLAEGDVLAALGRWHEAEATYAEVLALAQEVVIPTVAATALARLARVALAQGQHALARSRADEALALQSDWVCYQVLIASGDPRAEEILRGAFTMLM